MKRETPARDLSRKALLSQPFDLISILTYDPRMILKGHTRTGTWQISLALTALPLVFLAPIFSGMLIFHSHNDHRTHLHHLQSFTGAPATSFIAARSEHNHGHHHGHGHSHHDHGDQGLGEESKTKFHGNREGDEVVITIPDLGIAPPPPTVLPCIAARQLTGAMIRIEPVPTLSLGAIVQSVERAPPKRSGTYAVLVSSHALRI